MRSLAIHSERSSYPPSLSQARRRAMMASWHGRPGHDTKLDRFVNFVSTKGLLVNRDQGFQSAMKTLVSPGRFPWRLEEKTSLDPSRENMGNPSKVSLKVTRSNPVPSGLIR